MSHEPRLLILLPLLFVGCTTGSSPTSSGGLALSTAVQSLQIGQVVDGIPCLVAETPVYHRHVHLQILYDGAEVVVPPGIGVGSPWGVDATDYLATGACFAWLHVHDTTGVVHITTPEEKTFTLGQLFEVWGQPLGPGSALGYVGSLVVLVNGQPVGGDPRAVELTNLANIVLELGNPPAVPPPSLYDFGVPRL